MEALRMALLQMASSGTDQDADLRKLLVGQAEGACFVDVDLSETRAYRATTTWGNAFRRPHRYALLCSPRVEEPFLAKNGDGEPFERSRR
jgi:hypothetical protein